MAAAACAAAAAAAASSSSSSSSSSSMLITLIRCRWLRTHTTQRPNHSAPFPILPFNKSSSSSFPHDTHRPFLLPNAEAAASAGGTPMEDSKFVPLNPDDPTFGPPALLLLGFQLDEAVKIHKFLKDLDGEFLEVIFCTQDMITGSLWEAINTKQPPNLEASKIAGSPPRICFLSGLTGEEMMMFIDAFPESGLAGAVFAAVVPNSADKPLQEVIEEIMGDHEMMKSRESS